MSHDQRPETLETPSDPAPWSAGGDGAGGGVDHRDQSTGTLKGSNIRNAESRALVSTRDEEERECFELVPSGNDEHTTTRVNKHTEFADDVSVPRVCSNKSL